MNVPIDRLPEFGSCLNNLKCLQPSPRSSYSRSENFYRGCVSQWHEQYKILQIVWPRLRNYRTVQTNHERLIGLFGGLLNFQLADKLCCGESRSFYFLFANSIRFK